MTEATLTLLRRFSAPRERVERCELCAAPLALAHDHVFDPKVARLRCACPPCALVLAGVDGDRPRRIDSFATRLGGLELDDVTWQRLGVPVGLAFFSRRGASNQTVASLPGRAGVVESPLPEALWNALGERHVVLRSLAPDVEALLVRRMPGHKDYFHTSIDHCFRLAGLIRAEPGPLSGPEPRVIDDFFAELDRIAGVSSRSVV